MPHQGPVPLVWPVRLTTCWRLLRLGFSTALVVAAVLMAQEGAAALAAAVVVVVQAAQEV